MKKIIITVIAFGFVTGCSAVGSLTGSSGNSSNGSSAGISNGSSGGSSAGSFGGKRVKEIELEQKKKVVDTRTLIPVVVEVKVDRFRGGVLITARGTADQPGYGDVNLVPLNKGLPDENGIVSYEFKGDAPYTDALITTKRSKEMFAGASINLIKLPSVKKIRVIAEQNQITVSK